MNNLENLLIKEGGLITELRNSLPAKRLSKTQNHLRLHVLATGKGGDPAKIVAMEEAFLRFDLENHANSKMMVGSLQNALLEMQAAKRNIALVANPEAYKAIDAEHSLPRHRKAGLPYDEARQAFASHRTRLRNTDKTRLTEPEKALVDARLQNLHQAEKSYTQRQSAALGKNQGRRR